MCNLVRFNMTSVKMKLKRTIIIIASVFVILVIGFTFPHVKTFLSFDRLLDESEDFNPVNEKHAKATERESLVQYTSNNLQNRDPQAITSRCAILISPNFQKLQKLKKENPMDDFNTIVDDNEYYMAASIQYLDSLKVRIVHRNSEGTLIFKTTNGTIFKFQADSVFWAVLLFNGRTKPLQADMTDLNQDYKSYMIK
jgi:hypothetical protein